MISSIFGRTKPINFVLLLLFTIVFVAVFVIFGPIQEPGAIRTPELLINLLLIIFTVLLIDFINRKNTLSKNNSYISLFYVVFLCMFPRIFLDTNLVVANIFILLALRRLISIRSGLEVENKIFDASLWICAAAFFFSWSILFLIVVYMAIFLYSYQYYQNLLIPLVAVFLVAILAFTYYFMTDHVEAFLDIFRMKPEFNFNKYYEPGYLFPIVFLSGFGFIAVLIYFFKMRSKSSRGRAPGLLVLIHLAVALLVAAFAESPNTSELIFVGFPLSVIFTKYLETVKRKWLKEGLLWLFVIVPFWILLL
ncbi:DUF6427 family protein [Robertkochia aurantiaca]|uniref:DUF6427 family protein n=1 Tax=Robertkochia aurantiaca TaxID=2873700 RepID=UPI001CCA3595|nr:DUF6427 family protein [Robertkochia sp. 3YJGBD-33]